MYNTLHLIFNEDMILALTGQFKPLSYEPKKFQMTFSGS